MTATADRETFKTEAVRLVTTGNRSVPDVARSLGISENLLYNRIGGPVANKATADKPKAGVSQEEHDRVKEQLRRTEQERDILKKALGIFSRMT